MPIRSISFAGTTLAIGYHSLTAARIVELLYQHIATDNAGPARLTYRLCSDEVTARVQLYRDETLLYEGHCTGSVAELLLGDSCYQLAAHCRTGLLFHAAALSGRGCTLILPGISGAGKSTLTAWLINQGFDYLSDELVFVPWQTNTIQAFPRPLSLKKPARSVLSHYLDFEKQADHILSSDYVDLVPPTLFTSTSCGAFPPREVSNGNSKDSPQSILSNCKPGPSGKCGDSPLLIFPRYQRHSAIEWQPLSKVRAGLALMEHLINARNLPGHGLTEAARIAAAMPAYRLIYADFVQLRGQLESLLSSHIAVPTTFG
ncbi:MAG: hypothetical protein H6631_09910 [Anaerolineaceae bacterium]|nr:hypothetical protein [Anaerolineaceae bacterium]MCB9098492.1 hypothetical protein [Anaerolineales bacterium]